MSLHKNRRTPRAHWVLLLLAMVVLFSALSLDGYVHGIVGGSGRPLGSSGKADGLPAVPPQVSEGGPVLRLDGGAPQARRMPSRTIALTFDDGPDPVWTPRVLDVLRKHGAHGTFFVVGAKVNDNPELTRRILAEGHELGSHTFTHADLAGASAWRRELELTLTRNAIAGATGRQVTLFRPPFSSEPNAITPADLAVLRAAAAEGHVAVLADHDTKDWRRPGVEAIVRAATPLPPGEGAVVLLHDGGGDRRQTLAALDRLLGELVVQGYQFPTVSAALGVPDSTLPATRTTRLRGEALRHAQLGAAWLGDALGVFFGIALGLLLLRLVVQLASAGLHVRRIRRRGRQRLRYMGPVSIVVPAYNEAANIAATVRSLVHNDYPQLEVIVVDDGSTDNTAGIVWELDLPEVRVIRQPNAGKPAALNTGVAHAAYDLIVLVDGDTVFAPDALGRLVQPFTNPKVGAVSGNTKVANRRGLLGRWQHLEYVIGFNLDRRMFDVAECMPTVPGAIGAFRRDVLVEVGGVSSATLAEDTDLTMAVIRAGWKVVYEESALAWTEAPSSLRQLWRQRYRWCYGTMQAMWKHRRALVQRGPGGKLGRRGLAYLGVFQVALPLAAPAVDVFAIYGLVFLTWYEIAGVWAVLLGVQMATAAYALWLDKERLRPLWTFPLQQVVYRQLMYLVVLQSVVTALMGSRLGWHRVARTGSVAAMARDAEASAQFRARAARLRPVGDRPRHPGPPPPPRPRSAPVPPGGGYGAWRDPHHNAPYGQPGPLRGRI
ncbi:MAG TPA: bifunctional polysaccharide deacetylase/glycosyltransferase family 2 protein [Micromonosporaceae bacterium]|nr:bifunctional polysaccharide deacetylase/glycosyltransferase family 2 protein [Micromonosporaceae bacterium]